MCHARRIVVMHASCIHLIVFHDVDKIKGWPDRKRLG